MAIIQRDYACSTIHNKLSADFPHMVHNTSQAPVLISFIIPVYNTEQYLEECVDSVITQIKDIQSEILLINDESPDGCQKIIDSYLESYPFIQGYSQSHGRQGKARNTGLRKATGRYVFFLDSDDKLTSGTLHHFIQAAEEFQSDIVVGIARSFKGPRKWINKNHKTYRRKIINTSVEQTPLLLSDTSSCNKLYRRSFLIEQDIWFPEETFCEDVGFVYTSYLLSERITILPRIIHEYRGRKAGETVSGTQTFTQKRMLQCTGIFRKSLEQYKTAASAAISDYLSQKIILTTCQHCRRLPSFPDSSSPLFIELRATLKQLSEKQISNYAEHYTLPFLMIREGYFAHASAILNYGAIAPVVEDFFARLAVEKPETLKSLLKVNIFDKVHVLDRVISQGSKKNLTFVLNRTLKRIREDLRQLQKDGLQLFSFLLKALSGKHNISQDPKLKNRITTIIRQKTTGLLYKCLFTVLRPLLLRPSRKRVWLIGERQGKGCAESGFVFFKYCTEVLQLTHVYYVFAKNIPLPEWMAGSEYVLRKNTLRYFIHLLNTECLIFTNNELDVAPFIPSQSGKNPIRTVFFNHGVTYYNPGVYLRNIAHRFSMIIAVSEEEKQQKIDDWSLRDENRVKITGFPIFDPLHSFSVQDEILFCPTWRNQLDDLSESDFKESRYYTEIVSFLTCRRLHEYLLANNLKLIFRCHFRMADLLHVFSREMSDCITLEKHDSKRSLQNALKDAKILITDYSSILWDMAYMKKPVVLFQFDRSAFLAERGLHCFSTPEAGMKFALFVVNKEDLLAELAEIARNRFIMTPLQLSNVNSFFKYFDTKNCERVYQEIKNLC